LVLRDQCDMTGTSKLSNLPQLLNQPVELRPQDNALTLGDLWFRCFALGTTNTPAELAGFLRGELRPTRHEHNLVAVALNEYLSESGLTQFVPYVEDEALTTMPYLNASWSKSAAIPATVSWCDQ
jgi:hypothetical protein